MAMILFNPTNEDLETQYIGERVLVKSDSRVRVDDPRGRHVLNTLGPRGLMPNAKTGTVTPDVARAIEELKAGKIDFRVEKAGIVHAPMGKVSFGVEKIVQNLTAFLETIMRLKPSSSKGTYLKTIAVSTTMGPGIKLDVNEILKLAK